MGTPTWLYYLSGVLMLAVAGYGAVLLVLSLASRRPAGRDVDISHTSMGIAMAGMFVPKWAFGASAVWELIFGVLMVWFIARSIQSVERFGLHVPHALVHAAMSFAMLLMYWFPLGASSRAMAMTASATSGRMDPGLALLIAFVLFGSAIFTIASPNKGATHFGTHCRPRVTVTASEGRSAASAPASMRVSGIIATPSLLDASHVVMSVAMGLMLILMI